MSRLARFLPLLLAFESRIGRAPTRMLNRFCRQNSPNLYGPLALLDSSDVYPTTNQPHLAHRRLLVARCNSATGAASNSTFIDRQFVGDLSAGSPIVISGP